VSRPLFAYDLGSPYAWLAAERIDSLLDADWLPVLLGGIFRATGRSSWARTEARVEGMAEVARRAAERGLPPLRWPEHWPNDGLLAMRVAVHAHEARAGRSFALEAFRLQFTEGAALDGEDALREAAARAGLDPAGALEAAGAPEVKARLRENTDRALALGVFGVPAVVVDGEAMWGDDRLEEAASRAARSG
jgi:2-hydroxychromene-2-carboxylate isomerase